MKELKVLLQECITLTDEIYNAALIEDRNQIRSKSAQLIHRLNDSFPIIIEAGLKISPVILERTEKLLGATEVGDSIGTMDIVRFEIKSILEEYLESIGETFE
ncbi:hypothetical protein C8E03_105123 [Lachnotalea glycerini]|jgi:hypothetical protein|uniref:Uncharacterized protein n=1 Tax=Lachnotalea glycerini TaxID=1763509 RepID=A0A255IEF5_9FIRM|nr:hypothetical protein [Lachnotalea glycerini]PXV90215.1 hypothetical protein C8E03_105123 [Lachnotalea glycerini]RDY30612.1 hypothetical protein CG710_013695 [Lachnotalea glycerini]